MFRPVFQDFTSVSACLAFSRLETRDFASVFGGQAVKLTGRQADRSRKMNQAVQDQFLTERKKKKERKENGRMEEWKREYEEEGKEVKNMIV